MDYSEKSTRQVEINSDVFHYIGESEDGVLPHGKGTEWVIDGSKYVGDFKNGRRSGKGAYYLNDRLVYEGDFENNNPKGKGILYDDERKPHKGEFGISEYAQAKGNKWVSISTENGKKIVTSYKLNFDLQPRVENLKDTLQLFIQLSQSYTGFSSSFLSIVIFFKSKGKSAFILGGDDPMFNSGKMTFHIKDEADISLDPVEMNHNINQDASITVWEEYFLDKETLKTLCDGEITSLVLSGYDWNRELPGKDITFLLRAFWNGTYNDSDYTDYLNSTKAPSSKGCYVATCVYGSYDCPQVWTLRRWRDGTLDKTWAGRLFIKAYYAVSPTIVKWFGSSEAFRSFWKRPLDRLVEALRGKGVEDTPYHDKY